MASEYPFHIQTQPQGYQEKLSPDMVNEEQVWLCRGSQNVLLAPDGTTQSRKGMTACGDLGGAGTAPIRWADTWDTNTGIARPMRSRYDQIQVLYKDIWRTIATGFGGKVYFDGDTWFDKLELKDKYLFVNGSNNMWSWLGGLTEAFSGTTTTLTKKYVTGRSTGVNTVVFDATNKTITLTGAWANFITLGFQEGDIITVAGGGSPNVGNYRIRTVAASVLTLASDETIVNETNTGTVAAPTGGAANTVTGGNLTASTTYYYKITATDAFGGETAASTEFSGTTTTTRKGLLISWNPVVGASGYNIYRSTSSGVYTTPTKVVTIGAVPYYDYGDVNPLLEGVPPGASTMGMFIAVKGKETWAAERFATQGTDLSFMLNGTKYAYTGGMNTPTLTGITPNLPAIVAGDIITAPVIATAPSGGDIPGIANYDVIMTSENQVWLGSTISRLVYVSKNSNFADFKYTVPVRIAGEGGTVTLDSELKSLDVSDEGEVHATAGKKDIYKITLVSTTSGSTPGEEINVKKIKNSQGQSAVSHRAVTNTKNGLIYYSNQPSIDYLTRVEQIATQQGLPLSDTIQRLVARLDPTNIDSIYHDENAFFLLPLEGVLLMYDLQREIWQPPQLVGGAALSIIDNRLVVHSSSESSSYFMFDGLADDGKPIASQAVFSYRNGGERAGYKTADKYFVELRVNQATENVMATVDLGYNGSVASTTVVMSINDGFPYVEPPVSFGGIGTQSIGTVSLGGFYAGEDDDLILGNLTKVRRVIPLPVLGSEFFEMRFRISSDQAGAHFQVLSHGDNMIQSESVLSNLIKQD